MQALLRGVAYTKLRLPLTAWATSFGFVRWPRQKEYNLHKLQLS